MLREFLARLDPDGDGAAVDPLTWAETYRSFSGGPMRIPGPLRAIYGDMSPRLSVMKAAQMGLSEYAINLALWIADSGYAGRGNALYILPGGEHAGDFVQARVNPAIQASPYLISRIRPDGNTKDPDKVGLRRVGRGYTYWRTSGSRAGLRTVDADCSILDEYDVMSAWVLPMAQHRLDSSGGDGSKGLLRIVSTPTYPGAGVDAEYLAGDQHRYEVRCEHCGAWQVLEWERNVEVAGDPHEAAAVAAIVCAKCRDDLARSIERAWSAREDGEWGRWRAQQPERRTRSYHISQLYRPGVDLLAIARGLGSSNQETVQETWNQSLGMPHSPAGGQLSLEELIRACTEPRTVDQLAGVGPCRMGVDVGARLHVWIETDVDELATMTGAFDVTSFDEVGALMARYDVRTCVVDAHPELHAAQAFKDAHRGRVYLAEFVAGRFPASWADANDMDGKRVRDPKRQYLVQVDRTSAMDGFASRLRGESSEVFGWQPVLALPRDARGIPGLFAHLQAPVRRVVPAGKGGMRAVYDEGSKADHWFLAGVYCDLARQIEAAGPRRTPFAFA